MVHCDKKWYFFYYLLFNCLLVGAQPTSDYTFSVIDNTNGLPNNYIYETEMDALGFLWIATNDGLCRYDSPSNVKIFKSGDLGLESNNIGAIHATADSTLWIGTGHGGITKLNLIDNTSKTYTSETEIPGNLSNDEVLSIQKMQSGEIWIGTENGLNVLFPKHDSIYQFPVNTDSKHGIEAKAILDIHQDDRGWIWIGTWGGSSYLYLPSPDGNHKKGTFRKFSLGDQVGAEHVWKIYQESAKKYWFATHGAGIYAMIIPDDANTDQNNQDWSPKTINFRADPDLPNVLSSNYAVDIEKDTDGNLWFATMNGLNIILKSELDSYQWHDNADQQTLSFLKCIHNPNQMNSLSNDHITDVFQDKHGQLWIGTINGLNQYNWYSNQFNIHTLKDKDTGEFEWINNISVKDENTVILASDINGLLTYNFKSKSFEPSESYNIPEFNKTVTTIYKENDEELYVSTSEEIGIINPLNNEVQLYKFNSNAQDQNSNIVVRTILKDSNENVWVGSEIGLAQLDLQSGDYNWYNYDYSDSTTLSDNSITKIFEDQSGNIWLSTYNGLNLMKNSGDKIYFQRYYRDAPGIGKNIPSNKIISIDEFNGKTYFGSRNGIFYFDQEKSSFHLLDQQRSSYIISAILITQNGTLWASTSDGMLRYNLENSKSKLYGKKDGLGNISFRDGAAAKDSDGNIIFCTNQGFIQINADDLKTNASIPNVYITDIKSIDSDSESNLSGINLETITLPHDNYYISIDYAALNYNQAKYNQYAYRLKGFKDEDWQNTELQQVVYTNLDAGKYTFQVKASNNEGVWNETGKQLQIIVKPAFIETIWFKILLGLLAILSFLIANFIYTKNIRQKNEFLTGHNDRLNNQVKKTEAANTALEERERHMKILLEELDQSNQELLRSNKDLEQFAYVASHDMKEPLRTVGTFTNLLKKRLGEEGGPKTYEYMEFISEGVDRMSSLINSLLTYSQVGKKDLEFKMNDLNDILQGKLKDLSNILSENKVQISVDKLPSVYCAGDQIGMVFHNLILNGIKFNKSDNPAIQISKKEHEDYWEFKIKDNGIGIAKKYQKQIFEIFKRLHSKKDYEGTGIGLALCNKIINRHDGIISVSSAIGEGAEFSFTISKYIKPSQVKSPIRSKIRKAS